MLRYSGEAGLSDRLPYEIREAMIQTCGRAFWYKDPLRAFMISAGVSAQLISRYAAESKFPMVRHILSELDELGEDGVGRQKSIRIPDPRSSALFAFDFLTPEEAG